MSYDEYWYAPPERARAYREAHKLKRQYENQRLWLQGWYMMNAMLATSPFQDKNNPFTYPEEPLPLTKEEAKEQADRQAKRQLEKQLEIMRGLVAETNAQMKAR